jgi:uncharacterized protein YjbI with pentapeptide repeats
MANEEHIRILEEGVEAWNKWRQENPDIRPDLRGAFLFEAHLIGADLSRAYLSRAYLSRANLSEASLNLADLNTAHLSEADLRWADLNTADLSEADLRWAYLSRADLSWADLSRADLRGADLNGADLSNAKLGQAILNGADLSRAKLLGADLREANVEGAIVDWSVFGGVDLSEVKGLDTVNHHGPSTVGIDTIYKSKGKIPEVFLKGCGVPDNFIAYVGSLVGKAIEYYSCFISYSSKDQDLAERLHNDLQAKGVRCWFAPEDMKTGDRIRARIEQEIRVHDKLLLILSEHSIRSTWVESEVEAALAKETPEHTVLFPVRLDDTVMQTNIAWAVKLRRERHITDFANWKDHDAYQKAFERLLRDLKAESAEATE